MIRTTPNARALPLLAVAMAAALLGACQKSNEGRPSIDRTEEIKRADAQRSGSQAGEAKPEAPLRPRAGLPDDDPGTP